MTRRTMFSMLLALVAMVLAATGGVSVAKAQCCSFKVDVNCNLAGACLPISVKSGWQGGGTGGSQTDIVTACGVSVIPITAVPCPPQPTMSGYTLNGGPGIAFGGPPVRVALIPGACCVWTWATFDLSGCPIIYIVPC